MASPTWKISGDYFEACSCDSVCPCPTSGLAARPTQGYCDAGLVFHVERGSYGSATLDGLSFAVLLHTPGPMIAGNWTVGLIVDDKATPEQREALTAIGSGQGGGPMAAVGPLVGTFAGVEAKPIRIERSGMRRSVSIAGMLDIAVEGIPGASPDRADLPRQRRAPRRDAPRPREGLAGPHARLRDQLGRHDGQEQRALRPIFVELELGGAGPRQTLRSRSRSSPRRAGPGHRRALAVAGHRRCSASHATADVPITCAWRAPGDRRPWRRTGAASA